MCWTVYESNYIPGMNQCKNLRMQLCPHWITHPSWQELIALKWMVYSPLARGIKINARRVNSVSSSESPPPTLPILNQPAVPSTQLEEIRRGEKKKGAQENEERKKNLPFLLSASALAAGKKKKEVSYSSGSLLLSASIQLTQRSRRQHNNHKQFSGPLFLFGAMPLQTVQNRCKHFRCLSRLHLSLLYLIAWGTLLRFHLCQGVKVSHSVVK